MGKARVTGKRSRYRTVGMELAGALSAASQMALLCPPGYDEWVRRELLADMERARPDAEPAARRPR